MTPPLDLSGLRAKAEAAGGGQWSLECGDMSHRYVLVTDDDDRTVHYKYAASADPRETKRDEERAAHIAAASPATMLALLDLLDEAKGALFAANQFITNGVELGYIRLPTTPDPALETPEIVRSTLAKITGAS